MDGAGQQSTQNGESSQGETQGAGGDEVASGKDRETGAGLDGSQQAGQNQREQKSGASDNGQSKQPEKSDMKTASGEKRDQRAISIFWFRQRGRTAGNPTTEIRPGH